MTKFFYDASLRLVIGVRNAANLYLIDFIIFIP